MGILDFKGRAQADKWKTDLAQLNEKTDTVLGQVYSAIDEIKTESSGSFVDELVVTASDFADATVQMMQAMDSLKTLVENVIQKISDAIGDAVQHVIDKRNDSTNL